MMLFGKSLALSALSPLVRYGSVAALGAFASWYVTDTYHDWKFERAEAKHAAYKTRVQEATLAAFVAAQKASAAVHEYTSRVIVVYRDRAQQLTAIETEAKIEIDRSAIPDCRLPDGVRDKLNSLRGRAASIVDDSYRASSAVPESGRSGRLPREPRQ